MTIEDLFDPEHTSKPRNKLIAQIFYDLGLIERYGSGIQRILEACEEAGLPTPLFENFSEGFRIKFILPEHPVLGDPEESGTLNKKVDLQGVEGSGTLNGVLSERVVELIRLTPGIRRKEIIEDTGGAVRTVARCIADLVVENKIERRGSKKTGGYWVLCH